jgi:hypothetical protein
MKKIITIIAIALLTAGTTFAGNDNTTTTTNNKKETVATSNNNTTTTYTVTISDMNGKVVYTEDFTSNNDNVDIKLNVTNKLAKGTYVVTVVVDGEKMTQKLVVE